LRADLSHNKEQGVTLHPALDGLKNSTTASAVAAKRGLTVEELFA
jgi:hypothetical protein